MKASTAVARLPRGATTATTAPAREARGGQETGTDRPAKLARRRERSPGLSDYPTGAQSTRRSSDCLWSSSPFPRLLIDELAAPLFVTSCRPPAGASSTASSVPRDIPPHIALGEQPPRRHAAPGMSFFVSGMYRNNGLALPAIVERREAIAGLDGRIRPAGLRRTAG
jgi:hypothetical protein